MDTLNSLDMQTLSVAGRSSIDIESLFKMKEEYIFVFSGLKDKKSNSVEVFDVTRGIWREFDINGDNISSRTKAQVIPIFDDSLAIIGGRDEFGVPTDEITEFNVKMMKNIPSEWILPRATSGFATCLLKKGSVAICGGNDGQ